MAGFRQEQLSVQVVMLTAGAGEPLTFWHSTGTFTGLDAALRRASHFNVMISAAQLPERSKRVRGAATETFDEAGHLALDEKPAAVQSVAEFLA